jgi:hypothetical protein
MPGMEALADKTLVFLLLATTSVWMWQRALREGMRGSRFVAAAGLPAALLALVSLFLWIKGSVQWAWSAARLAPALGILRGYDLYSGREHGPINGWLYGPVPALCWLPAGLARTAIGALSTAETLNLLFLLSPLFAVCQLAAGRGFERRVLGLWCGAAVAASLIFFYPTWYMVAVLTADATAVGFGVVACVLLSRDGPGHGRLALAAALTAAAVWSKQIAAPLIVVQLAWLLVTGRGHLVWRYSFWLAAFIGGFALAFIAAFGAANMYFNMWVVPTSQFLVGGWGEALRRTGLFIAATLPATAVAFLAWARGPVPWGRRSIPILPFAGFLMLPVGVLTSLKIGAETNSIHSYYYLIAAGAVGLTALAAERPAKSAAVIIPVACVCLIVAPFRALGRQQGGLPLLMWASNEAAFEFAQRHPGQTYFPGDPLATLLADGRSYHLEYGIADRMFAGITPTSAQIQEGLPKDLSLIIYPFAGHGGLMVKLIGPEVQSATESGHWTLFRCRNPAISDGRPKIKH